MPTITLTDPQNDTTADASLIAANNAAIAAVLNGGIDGTNVNSIPAAKITDLPTVPVGTVLDYAGSSAPTGYLLCDGSEVLRATYAALDAIIGTTYGAYTDGSGGVGTTHMRLPNAKGRVSVARDSGQTEFDTLGETGGAKTVSIAHTHTVDTTTNSKADGGQLFQEPVGTDPQTGAMSANANPSVLQPYLVLNKIIKT